MLIWRSALFSLRGSFERCVLTIDSMLRIFFFCYSICFGFLLCVLFLFLVFALFYLLRVACNVHLNLIWNHFNFKQVMMAFQSSPFKCDFFQRERRDKERKKYIFAFIWNSTVLIIYCYGNKKLLCVLSPPYSSSSSHTLRRPQLKKKSKFNLTRNGNKNSRLINLISKFST